MKKILQFVCLISIGTANIYAQNTIVTNDPLLPALNGTNDRAFWSRRGNTPLQGTNNIFGTLYNASIYHYTSNSFKMKLNGDYTYAVNGFNAARNGYLLIGQEQPFGGGIPFGYLQNKGAFSRLHLHDNASVGGFYDVESGYRPWMRNGVYFSGFSDAGYLGQKSNGFDNTDMIFTWSDNSGQDNMTFAFTRFTGLAPNSTTVTSGDLTGEGINGREVMRFAASGNIGMGPRFDAGNPPASDLHIRSENLTSSFLLIDNQEALASNPTATSATNGGLFGMLGNANPLLNGNILLYNQENRHLLLGTNYGVNPVTTTPSNANEKVRITAVGTPTDLPVGGYGVYNPFGRPLADTYVAISANPANSIKRPTSLLQMGDDMDPSSGVRNWMYTGTMISRETDHLFIGLKNEGLNRNDAVIAWGDDDLVGSPGIGPDNLRFIFTETTVFGNTTATDNDGAEVGRFVPSCNGCPVQKASFGIGDFSPTSSQPYGNPNYIGATLDIDGDLRVRTVTPNPALNRVLVIDPLDQNRVHYRDISNLYNSNNGIYNNNNLFQWGVSCADPNFATNVAAFGINTDRSLQLTADFHFFDPSLVGGCIGIGSTPATNCTPLQNRLVIEALGPDQSGIRLMDLTFSSPASANNGKVLSVDNDGDIILVDNGAANNGLYSNNGILQLGVDCNNPNFNVVYPGQGFNDDRAIGLTGNNLIFDGNGGGQVGIGMGPCSAVNNRLEITGLGPDQSGLRFTNLTINSPSFTPAPGFEQYLTVTLDGDVVLANLPPSAGGIVTADNGLIINNPGNVQLGQINSGSGVLAGAQLLRDSEIPMNGFNMIFYGIGNPGNNIFSIGQENSFGNPLLTAKNFVFNDTENNAGLFYTKVGNLTGTSNALVPGVVGVMGKTENLNGGAPTSTRSMTGVYGHADGANNTANYQHHLYGVYGQATHKTNSALTVAHGVYGTVNSLGTAGISYGGYFRSYVTNGTTNYGVKGEANFGTASNIGGWFNASGANATGVYCTASIGSGNNAIIINGEGFQIAGGNNFSDSLIKTNVQDLTNATQILSQLDPKTFEFRYNDFPTINFDHDSHFGVIAQDVEDVLPTLVGVGTIPAVLDSNNNIIYPAQTIKTVVYEEFIPILIAGFNEQSEKITSQDSIINSQDSVISNLQSQLNNFQTQLNDMMAMINNCCAQGNNLNTPDINNNQNQYNVTNIEVKLTDNDCVLNVNSPNPFRDNTTINYVIPETANFAQIIFYNSLGQAIKIVDINDKGAGRLNVYGEDLRSGMYSYSLIIDGNVCETHKMIKQ